MKDINIRAKTIKHLEENKDADLHDGKFVNCFLHMIPKPWATAVGQQEDKLDTIKI